MSRSHSSRPGLSLIEVLVLLGIAVIVIGLFLPATRRVRDAAARTQSLSNLGQIAKATQNWAGSSKDANSLPHGDFVQKTTSGHELIGPFAAIIPQMESTSIFDRGSPNDVCRWYISPSDSTFASLGGHASYAWNGGWIVAKKNEAKLTPKDGASNTILLCERVMLCNGSDNRWSGKHPGTAQDWSTTPYLPGVTVPNENAFATAARPPAWATNAPVKSSSTCDISTPSGCHFGVILVAMGDGSTRSVTKASATEQNWSASITPAGNDKLDSNW